MLCMIQVDLLKLLVLILLFVAVILFKIPRNLIICRLSSKISLSDQVAKIKY